MRKTLRVARRDYTEAVCAKAFVIGVLVAPFFMFGSVLGVRLFEGHVDVTDKAVALVDRSGLLAEAIVSACQARNAIQVLDPETGEKVQPAYLVEVVEPEADALAQRLELSDRVRDGEIFAFMEIAQDALDPRRQSQASAIAYYSLNPARSEIADWLAQPINLRLRALRGGEFGLDEEAVGSITQWTNVESLSLLERDEATGQVRGARRSDRFLERLMPIIPLMFMMLLIMMSAAPAINSTVEEKTQRISEVLLGSVRPFELMAGKMIAILGVSFTAGVVYVAALVGVVYYVGMADRVPLHILPWFFAFTFAAVSMHSAMFMAVGSACNGAKEAQQMMMPLMLTVMIPFFFAIPVIREPSSMLATVLSLIPPFTPMVMMMRLTVPGAVPAWQPWVGLLGVAAFTVLYIWAAGRVFRIGLLAWGQPPKFRRMLQWIIRG